MLSLADSASGIFAPIIAGAVIGVIGISGIMTFDIITFIFAISMLLLVYIPEPETTVEGAGSRGSFLRESFFGFKYIFERPSLLGLQMIFFAINFIAMFSFILLTPMILARTNNNELLLGAVMSIGSIGGVIGGLVMSTWGGPKRKINGVLIGMMLIGLSQGVIGLGQALLIWAAGNFLVAFILPILNGSNQAIWQAKVAPDVQGRVFATRRLIAQITAPIAMIMAGPLADKLFGPAMLSSGALAPIFGNLLGTGPGAGMSLMFMFSGIGGFLIGLSGYAIPAVRDVEVILPDFDALPAAPNPEKLLREKQMQELLAARQRLLGLPDSQHRKNELRSISRNLRALGQQPVEE
jgi:hypothetical protein